MLSTAHCVKPQYWHAFWHLVHIFATISPIWMKFQLAYFFCKSLIINIYSRPYRGQLVNLLAFVPKMLLNIILDLLKSYQNFLKKGQKFWFQGSLWFNSHLCNQFSKELSIRIVPNSNHVAIFTQTIITWKKFGL